MVHHSVEPIRPYTEEDLHHLWRELPPEVVDYICQNKTLQHRRERTQAYLMLLDLLRRTGKLNGHLPIYKITESGKPRLDCSVEHDYHFVQFSISHCSEAVAVAVADDIPVGIDVECRRKVSPSLMERVCTPAEIASIEASADPDMTFLQYWTRKEATLKADGSGIKGFDSMKNAELFDFNIIYNLHTDIPDVVGAIAWENRNSRDAKTVERMALGIADNPEESRPDNYDRTV